MGIGKEYATDRSLLLLKQRTATNILLNYGSDIAASDAPRKILLGLWELMISYL
ncbi:MAG: hypothetical protein HN826_14605 [Methylococcales bacterium]|nr:hypothetical protein [Methylococcales bacterium]